MRAFATWCTGHRKTVIIGWIVALIGFGMLASSVGSDFSEDVVLLMGGLSDMEVKAEVGEHEVVGIHEGDLATVEIDAMPDKQFKGRVVAVGKNAQIKNQGTDAEVTTFFVRVGLDSPPEGALPGLSAAVSIATAKHPSVLTMAAPVARSQPYRDRCESPVAPPPRIANMKSVQAIQCGSAVG